MQGLLSNTQTTQLEKRYTKKLTVLVAYHLQLKSKWNNNSIGFPSHSSGKCLGAMEHL